MGNHTLVNARARGVACAVFADELSGSRETGELADRAVRRAP